MTAKRSEADVLALAAEQADARRARAEATLQPEPASVTDLLRERLAQRAERRGQLNVGGA